MTDQRLTRAEPPALPDYIKKGDLRGTENIEQADIKPPALRIAQSSSPETKRSERDKYVEGLREGDFFNSLTKVIYGEDPVELLIVNQLGHRHAEFDKDGKVVEFDVPDNDPRTEFTFKEENGKRVRVKPVATKFYDYLVYVHLPEGWQLMTMSLKSTQLKKAVVLNSILKLSKLPSFAHLIEATPVPESGVRGSWYGWRFTMKGWPAEEIYNEASGWYNKMVGKTIVVETEGDDTPNAEGERVPF